MFRMQHFFNQKQQIFFCHVNQILFQHDNQKEKAISTNLKRLFCS